MAGPPCMSNDGNAAVFVGTFLENGDSVALCGDCLPGFAIAMTASLTGIDGDLLMRWIGANGPAAPEDPATEAAELAAPPQHAEPPVRGGEPPAQAPADDDEQAGWDFTRPARDDGPTQNGSSAPPTGTADQDEPPPTRPKRQARTTS